MTRRCLYALLFAAPLFGCAPADEDPGSSASRQSLAPANDPYIRFLEPAAGSVLSGSAPVALEGRLPAPDQLGEVSFGVLGQSVSPLWEFASGMTVSTFNFENGPQTLVARLSDLRGNTWQDTLDVVFDNPDFQLARFEPNLAGYRNGEEAVFELEYTRAGLELTLDLSELDSNFRAGAAVVEELGQGRYAARYSLSRSNTRADGEHVVQVLARDDSGRELAMPLSVTLANTRRMPLVVQGGVFVSGSPALVLGSPDAPLLEDVSGGGTLLTGSTRSFSLRWSQAPDRPAAHVLVQLEGHSGHWVVPITDAGAQNGSIELNINLPAFEEAFDDGTFDLIFTIIDAIGNAVDSVTELVSLIGANAGAVQVSLSWDTAVDLDVGVVDPAGNLIDFENRLVGSGELDIDSNPLCEIDGINAENVSWDFGDVPQGEYQVRVNLFDACGQSNVNWKLTARFCGREENYSGALSAADVDDTGEGRVVTTFTVDCSQILRGRVTYADRPSILDSAGPPPAVPKPVRFAPIRVTTASGLTTLQETTTNEDGEYAFAFRNVDEDDLRIEVEASWVDPSWSESDIHFEVTPIDDQVAYRFVSPEIDGAGMMSRTINLDIGINQNAGAFNIRDIVQRSYEWLNATASASEAKSLGFLQARWTKGTATTISAADGSTHELSYQQGSDLFINGTDDDQDEWDDTVIAHEFMHFVVRNLAFPPRRGGPHSGPAHPHLAFNEGLATGLGQSALRNPTYLSETRSGRFFREIEAGTANGSAASQFKGTWTCVEIRGRQECTQSGAPGDFVSEYLISMLMYDLIDAKNEPHDQLEMPRTALRTLFNPSAPLSDGGGNELDLIDYLDSLRAEVGLSIDSALECLVQERDYPYPSFPAGGACSP